MGKRRVTGIWINLKQKEVKINYIETGKKSHVRGAVPILNQYFDN
jgi:hypothetical protein